MKIEPASAPLGRTEPGEDEIRACADHRPEPGKGAPDHELDNGCEATARRKAALPAARAHRRLHRHIGAPITPAVPAPLAPVLAPRL